MKIMLKKPLVILDSNELIFGLIGNEPYPKILIENLSILRQKYGFRINKQILREVLDNIPNYDQGKFFRLVKYDIINYENSVTDENLLNKYKNLKLKKGDNVIAAYADKINANFLISENRHFLKELKTKKFKVVNGRQFIESIL